MGGKVADSRQFSAIEQRARKIADPLERLRYLRRATAPRGPSPAPQKRWIGSLALAILVFPLASDTAVRTNSKRIAKPSVARSQTAPKPDVWLVEHTKAYDVYSNGLRIENEFVIANEPRSYRPYSLTDSMRPGPRRTQPAGVVFHTTESDQAPFEAGRNRALQRIGRDLLRFVRDRRAYHFVIDRFGRVYRVVAETDAANHAGHSLWADSQWAYLNLNSSFLSVAFEARMDAGEQPINTAQIHAGAVLTQMLRSKYDPPLENLVTHAQVSVNPDNMRIGWHTDWGSGFPFREIGLPDNYATPNPGVYLFGFEYDFSYMSSTGPEAWKGLGEAEARLRADASARGLRPLAWRKALQRRFKEISSALQRAGATEGETNE